MDKNGLLIIKQEKQQASQILIYAEINENLNEKIKKLQRHQARR